MRLIDTMVLVASRKQFTPGKPINSVEDWDWDPHSGPNTLPFCGAVLVFLFGLCPIPDPVRMEYLPAVVIKGNLDNEDQLELHFHVNTRIASGIPELAISFSCIRRLLEKVPYLKSAQVLFELRGGNNGEGRRGGGV